MRRHLRAEWTKSRTVPSTVPLLLGVVALTVAGGAMASAATTAPACAASGCTFDLTKLSLTGVLLGQAVVVVLAVLAMSGEYGTGMVRTTFTAMPRRSAVLAAKAAVLTGLTLVAAVIGVLASVLAARLILPGNGFTPAHGYPALSLADGPTLRAAAGSVLCLVLVALLGLGVAAAVRDPATAIGVVLGLLYLFPLLIFVISDQAWQRLLWQVSPLNAGLAVQSTTDAGLPLGPGAGLVVLAAWAALALLAGGLRVRLRDA
ncbi:ABC transporter permease [Sphaerisporangium corydalis]|uniref:ABC transporter permease n=1 Tax=Sphaerisporangium corydalis TaxID=1441875 RepID=A0ABV9EFW9_9ACTN|nr:ABC transporter permease [Sphaerisporangium corydalis]